jgi:aminopeptidase N
MFYTTFSYGTDYQKNSNIYVIHYKFDLSLSDSSNIIAGKAYVTVKFLSDSIKSFYLDLTDKKPDGSGMVVHSVFIDSLASTSPAQLKFSQHNDKLNIYLKRAAHRKEQCVFIIDYSGIPADGLIISKNKFGERTFFGDNWPNRAHNWLPCIDYPSDKATCEFIVTAPSEYKVIANGRLVEETDLENGFKLTDWSEDVPIPTKIMVIGIARFSVQYLGDVNCIPIETWVYPADKKNGFYDFSVAKNILNLYESYLGSFPYEKLADVESTTRYGGMENASNIFYDENEVTGRRLNEVTIAHEIAHQWFGDSVTEEEWSQIWLSEGFATFFQNFFIAKQFGTDSLMNVLKYDKQLIFSYYYKKHSPIVDTTITNLNDLLNPNSYQKGAYVLRMLRHLLGEKKFWDGVRFYYKTYKNQNAMTKDFERCMEKASGENLNWFFNEWVYKPGFMNLNFKWSYDQAAKKLQVNISQVGTIFKMPVDLAVYLAGKNNLEIKKLDINKSELKVTYNISSKPERVVIDPYQYVLLNVNSK